MVKYLIALLLIAGVAWYMVYSMFEHPQATLQEIEAIKKDKVSVDSWGKTLDGTVTIEKKQKFIKPFTDRPPQEEEAQEQVKTAPVPLPDKKVEVDVAPMPPEQQAQEPELDGEAAPEMSPEEAPLPPVQYGQYPCSWPDCPGNPDVEDYLSRRWRWEGGGPQWYGRGGPGGFEVQAPFFQLHIRPRRNEWRRHWKRERMERRW